MFADLPANPLDLLAQVTRLMPQLDALIASYVDPLTAQDVLELAQCWTLRRVLLAAAAHTPDAEWTALAQLGHVREAVALARLRPENEPRFSALLRIYQASARHHDDLLDTLYTEIEGLLTHKQSERFRRALEKFIDTELDGGRYETALHIARRLDTMHFARKLRHIAEEAIKAGDVDTALEYVRLMPNHHYTHELTRISLTATLAVALAHAGRSAQAEHYFQRAEGLLDDIRDDMYAIQQQGETPVLPDNLQYASAVCDLALAYMRVGRLKDAERRFAQAFEPPPMLQTDAAARRYCEEGFACVHDPIEIMVFVAALPAGLRQSVVVLEAARRLIQLGETAMAKQWLKEVEQHSVLRRKALELLYMVDDGQLIDEKAAQEEQLLHGLSQDQRRTRLYELAHWLAKAGRVEQAAKLATDIDHVDMFFHIHTLIVQHWIQQGALEHARNHVDDWLNAAPPSSTDISGWQSGLYWLLYDSARYMQPHDPALARRWLERAIHDLDTLKSHPHYDLRCEELAQVCAGLGAEDLAQTIVTTMAAPSRVMAEVCYRMVDMLTTRGQPAAARFYLQLARERRDMLPDTRRTALDTARRRLAEYEGRDIPDMPMTPQPGVSRFAQQHRLEASSRIAAFWREQDTALALHLFLSGLIESGAILDEVEPGLYPLVVRACGAIMARFSPEWAAL